MVKLFNLLMSVFISTARCSKNSSRQISSGCTTKFCRRDFVLKYVVIGEKKKNFQVESGLFRDLFRGTSGFQSFFSKYAEEKKRHQQKYSTTTVGMSLFFRYTGMVRYCVICINVSKIEVIYIIFLFCRRYM